MTARRWVCPTCGAGVLAPGRMRADDTRRYCLKCSAKAPRLVERTCPALDRERETKAAAAAARRQGKAERERTAAVAARSAGRFDLLAEAKRIGRLPSFREQFSRDGWFPTFTFRRHREGWKAFTSGHCHPNAWPCPEITMTIGTDEFGAVATLLHEMTHAWCPVGERHSTMFWTSLQRMAREAFPKARFDFANARQGWQIDRAIRNGIAGLYGEDALTGTPPVTDEEGEDSDGSDG